MANYKKAISRCFEYPYYHRCGYVGRRFYSIYWFFCKATKYIPDTNGYNIEVFNRLYYELLHGSCNNFKQYIKAKLGIRGLSKFHNDAIDWLFENFISMTKEKNVKNMYWMKLNDYMKALINNMEKVYGGKL